MKHKSAKHSVVIQALANRMKSACEGIDFIGNDGRPYDKDYEREAIWWVSCQIAERMREDHTVKDWAHYVMEGMEALTVEDVSDFFYPEGEEWYRPLPTEEECVKWLHG